MLIIFSNIYNVYECIFVYSISICNYILVIPHLICWFLFTAHILLLLCFSVPAGRRDFLLHEGIMGHLLPLTFLFLTGIEKKIVLISSKNLFFTMRLLDLNLFHISVTRGNVAWLF